MTYAAGLEPAKDSPGPCFAVGDHVEHIDSGWSGAVASISASDGGMGQGPLVTVNPTHPRPKEDAAGNPIPADWPGWSPITVTADELRRITA